MRGRGDAGAGADRADPADQGGRRRARRGPDAASPDGDQPQGGIVRLRGLPLRAPRAPRAATRLAGPAVPHAPRARGVALESLLRR